MCEIVWDSSLLRNQTFTLPLLQGTIGHITDSIHNRHFDKRDTGVAGGIGFQTDEIDAALDSVGVELDVGTNAAGGFVIGELLDKFIGKVDDFDMDGCVL